MDLIAKDHCWEIGGNSLKCKTILEIAVAFPRVMVYIYIYIYAYVFEFAFIDVERLHVKMET